MAEECKAGPALAPRSRHESPREREGKSRGASGDAPNIAHRHPPHGFILRGMMCQVATGSWQIPELFPVCETAREGRTGFWGRGGEAVSDFQGETPQMLSLSPPTARFHLMFTHRSETVADAPLGSSNHPDGCCPDTGHTQTP